VCVPALDEEKTIGDVLTQAALCPEVDSAYVVVNGTTDGTARRVLEVASTIRSAGRTAGRLNIRVRDYGGRLGHDVGRAVAARWALAEGAGVLVFLDADFPIPASDITPFVQAVRGGVDLALNRLTPLVEGWASSGPVASARRTLNGVLGRPDLGLDSLLSVPHALSPRAVRLVGYAALAVPPLAQALAVMAGLDVRSVHTVNTIVANRGTGSGPRPWAGPDMAELILGDHLQAIGAVLERRGPRGGFSDLGRDLSVLRAT